MLAQRSAFADPPHARLAADALAQHLLALVTTLEPGCLGVYWPVHCEFNASQLFLRTEGHCTLPLALPYVLKSPPRMAYRAWDGQAPTLRDEAGIASVSGADVLPEVVLVPCLGFTDEGYRLGYGGGYFDRWLAANPQVLAVGVAWEIGRIEQSVFQPQPHDVTMTLIVTERGPI